MRTSVILIVEDEPSIADTLIYALRTEGFKPVHCLTGQTANAAFARDEPDLVILDVGLPDCSGFDWCKALRQHSAVPVLFLTARESEIDRVVGLEIGGDDYVTKPFSPREVTARVRAILRRGPMASTTSPEPGKVTKDVTESTLQINAEKFEAIYCGRRLHLTRYEFRLLRALTTRPGHVLSRDQLMEAGWEDPGSSLDRTVDAHIKTLRAKLREIQPDGEPIQTHRGLGYAWRLEP